MPTSGDLKSGDSLFFTTPTPRQIDRAPNGNGLGLNMKSYMKYILSKFTIIVLDAEINNLCQWLHVCKNAPETVFRIKKIHILR